MLAGFSNNRCSISNLTGGTILRIVKYRVAMPSDEFKIDLMTVYKGFYKGSDIGPKLGME